jgi:hypothetical protein
MCGKLVETKEPLFGGGRIVVVVFVTVVVSEWTRMTRRVCASSRFFLTQGIFQTSKANEETKTAARANKYCRR